jgi:hypothetical protein
MAGDLQSPIAALGKANAWDLVHLPEAALYTQEVAALGSCTAKVAVLIAYCPALASLSWTPASLDVVIIPSCLRSQAWLFLVNSWCRATKACSSYRTTTS